MLLLLVVLGVANVTFDVGAAVLIFICISCRIGIRSGSFDIVT